MIGSKIEALHQFFLDQKLCSSEQLDSWIDDGQLEPGNKKTANGFKVCDYKYQAIFTIDRYNQLPDKLMALLAVWLMDVDAERYDDDQNLPAPSVDVEVVESDVAHIEIEIEFIEGVHLIEDPDGDIPFNGALWVVAPESNEDATAMAVGHDDQQPTDLEYSE